MSKYRVRCRHEITRDLLETVRDGGREGVAPSRLLFGKSKGSLSHRRLKPWLRRLSGAGFIELGPGRSITSRLCTILPKGRLWLLRFNQLEEMIEGKGGEEIGVEKKK